MPWWQWLTTWWCLHIYIYIYIYTYKAPYARRLNFVKLRIAEQNIGSTAPIKSHVYHFLTPLAQNAGFLFLTPDHRKLPPFCMKPVAATYPRTNAQSATVMEGLLCRRPPPLQWRHRVRRLFCPCPQNWCSRCCLLEVQHNESVSSAFVCVIREFQSGGN